MPVNLPNFLTLSRIGAIPAIVALFWFDGATVRWVMLAVYSYACITDFFDGYAARSMGSISSFGRFMDPVADKLLVASLILMLVAFDRIAGLAVLPGLVILCRELLVSGLREFLAEIKVGVPVSGLAKWKTFIQMIALGFLIVGDASPAFIPAETIGEVGLWVAAALTIVTGYDYLKTGMAHLSMGSVPARNKKEPTSAAKNSAG
jgi:cardiolipin synthase